MEKCIIVFFLKILYYYCEIEKKFLKLYMYNLYEFWGIFLYNKSNKDCFYYYYWLNGFFKIFFNKYKIFV